MTIPKSLRTDFRPPDRWLTLAFILGPMAVLTNVMVSYMLAFESCTQGSKLLLHACAAGSLLLALAGAGIAQWTGRRVADTEIRDLSERIQWLVAAATILSFSSAVMIVATEIPNLILRSCD